MTSSSKLFVENLLIHRFFYAEYLKENVVWEAKIDVLLSDTLLADVSNVANPGATLFFLALIG